jgi:phosphatidylethanolamine/phosphatidyl-N-methylethanolamine N-methyltransferase
MLTTSRRQERLLFIKNFLKNPKSMGAVAPSSNALGRLICNSLRVQSDSYVIEIGGGTGSFTRALIKGGVQPTNLVVIEIHPELCAFLKKKFPDVLVIQGDATHLRDILPPHIMGHVSAVISGIPLLNLSEQEQRALLDSSFDVMDDDGAFLQFTYSPISPLKGIKNIDVVQKRLGRVLWNIPPATVWQFKKIAIDSGIVEIQAS